MYLDFIGCLILMRYVYQLIAFLLTLPFRVILPFVLKTQNSTPWVYTIIQIVVSITYSALIAIISYIYSSRPGVKYALLYGSTGFIATFIILSLIVAGKQKLISNPLPQSQFFPPSLNDPRWIIQGASIGALIGFITYFVFFFCPEMVLAVPGSNNFISIFISTSDKLMSYWYLKAYLFLSALVYLLIAGFPLLIGAGILLFSKNKLKP